MQDHQITEYTLPSVHFSHSVVSNSLQPHGLKHTRLPCPSPIPGACSNSCSSNHLILCRPLLPPSIFASIRVFSSESVLHIRWPKYWSVSFSISPSNGHSGLISFRTDWFDLLGVQGTSKSLLQHHSLKASILQPSAFSTVQVSNGIFMNFSFIVGLSPSLDCRLHGAMLALLTSVCHQCLPGLLTQWTERWEGRELDLGWWGPTVSRSWIWTSGPVNLWELLQFPEPQFPHL